MKNDWLSTVNILKRHKGWHKMRDEIIRDEYEHNWYKMKKVREENLKKQGEMKNNAQIITEIEKLLVELKTNMFVAKYAVPVDKPKKSRVARPFVPPNLMEIEVYISENDYIDVDGKAFYKYYTESGWIDSRGKPVKNWKQKVITWAGNSINKINKKDDSRNLMDDIEAMSNDK